MSAASASSLTPDGLRKIRFPPPSGTKVRPPSGSAQRSAPVAVSSPTSRLSAPPGGADRDEGVVRDAVEEAEGGLGGPLVGPEPTAGGGVHAEDGLVPAGDDESPAVRPQQLGVVVPGGQVAAPPDPVGLVHGDQPVLLVRDPVDHVRSGDGDGEPAGPQLPPGVERVPAVHGSLVVGDDRPGEDLDGEAPVAEVADRRPPQRLRRGGPPSGPAVGGGQCRGRPAADDREPRGGGAAEQQPAAGAGLGELPHVQEERALPLPQLLAEGPRKPPGCHRLGRQKRRKQLGGRAFAGVTAQAGGHQPLQGRRYAVQIGRLVQGPVNDRGQRVPAERGTTGGGEGQHGPEREHVGGRGERPAADLLGGHVTGGADDLPLGGERPRRPAGRVMVGGLADAEVDDPGPVLGQQDVGRFEVAVQQPRRVDRDQRLAEPGAERAQKRLGHRPVPFDRLLQAEPVDVRGRQPRDGPVRVGLDHGAGERAADPLGGRDLGPEPGPEPRVPGELRPHHLDRHRPSGRGRAQVHPSHAALAQPPQHPVPADAVGVLGHWRGRHEAARKQSNRS